MLLHVLGHVQLHQRRLVAEEELSEGLSGLRLTDSRRAEEDERTAGTLGVFQTCPRPPNGEGDGFDGIVLADDAPVELVFHA